MSGLAYEGIQTAGTHASPRADTIVYQLRVGVLHGGASVDAVALDTAIGALVRNIKGRLRDRGGATPVAWTIVSHLADEPTRILAALVIEAARGRLEAILPHDAAAMRAAASDGRALEALLSRDGTEVRSLPADLSRHDRTQAAAEQVVEACEMLIAVCGDAPSDPAATLLAAAVRSGRLVFRIDPNDPGRGAQVLRLASPGEEPVLTAASARLVEAPIPTRRPKMSLGFVRLSAFNQRFRDDPGPIGRAIDRRRGELAREVDSRGQVAGLPPEALEPVLRDLLPLAAKADVLAELYQGQHRRGQRLMYGLAATAVTLGVAQVLLLPGQTWPLYLKLLAIAVSIAVLWWVKRRFIHDRWLYSRYLAEQLRAAVFMLPLACSGRMQASGRGWTMPLFAGTDSNLSASIRAVIARAEAACVAPARALLDPLRRYLIDGWIAHQMLWHERTGAHKHHRATRNHRITVLFLLATLSAVLGYLLWSAYGPARHDGAPAWTDPGAWFKLVAISAPAWAAAWHGLARHQEDERVAKRSEELSYRLAQSVTRAEAVTSLDELRDEAVRASDVMAAELQDWLVQVSFHRPEPVV